MKNRLRMALWGLAAVLLLVPLIAMKFTTEVNWTTSDFIFAGFLILGVGIALELALRVSNHNAYRAGAALALAAAFFMTWVNLAVGIIGNENNPANLMYWGVLGVALLGALVARFKPAGMARAMVGAAVAQATVMVVALIAGFGFTGPITVFFCGVWLSSAWLFGKSAKTPSI